MKKVILIIMTVISLGANAQNPEKNISENIPIHTKENKSE